MSGPARLAVWSGPRNLSTALMRAWENRPDTVVVDEPLYACYLRRTGLEHPGREQVLAAQSDDLAEVVAGLLAPQPEGVAVHYAKHMSHHVDVASDLSWTTAFRNVLLVRDPAEVVASYVRSREACEPEDIGLLQQERLFQAWAPDVPPVVDAADFLADPERYLRWLCDWLEVAFTPRMLSWPAGPRESDGVWAPYWYAAVQRSTGFSSRPPLGAGDLPALSPHDAAVAEACRPAYERLHALRLRL